MGIFQSSPPKPWVVEDLQHSYASTYMSLAPQAYTLFEEIPELNLLRDVAQSTGEWNLASLRERGIAARSHFGLRLERCHVTGMTMAQKEAVNHVISSVLRSWTVHVTKPNHLGLPGPLWKDACMMRFWPETSGSHMHKDFDRGSDIQSYAGTLLFLFPLREATPPEREAGEKCMQNLEAQGKRHLIAGEPDGLLVLRNGNVIRPPEAGVKMVFIPLGMHYAVHAPPAGKTLYIIKVPLCYLNRDESCRELQWWMRGATRQQFLEETDWDALCRAGNENVCKELTSRDLEKWKQENGPRVTDRGIYAMRINMETDRQAEDRAAWACAHNLSV